MEYKYLSEVSEIRQGRHFYPDDSPGSESYYLIKSGNLIPGLFRPMAPFSLISISKETPPNLIRDNDILLCHMGSHAGKSSFFRDMGKGKFVYNQTICVIKSIYVDPLYLFSYLNTYALGEYIRGLSITGGNRTYLSKKTIQQIPVVIPSAEVQSEISKNLVSCIHLQKKSLDIRGELESAIVNLIKGGFVK